MGGTRRFAIGLVGPAFIASLAAAGAVAEVRGVSVGNVEVWGTTHPDSRAVDGALRVHVKTPIGRIPITGRARATYSCDATFGGSIHYSGLVRFFARLKGVDLVSQADGALRFLTDWDCATPPDSFRGQVTIRDTVLTGFLRMGGDSIPLRGDTWNVGDSTYHSYIRAQRDYDPFTVRINLYER